MKFSIISALVALVGAVKIDRIHGGGGITATLQPDHCFNLRSGHNHRQATQDWVLGTTLNDKGQQVLSLVHFDEHSRNQEWYWHEEDQSLRNGDHPDMRVDVRAGGIFGDVVLAPTNETNQFQLGFTYNTGNNMLLSSDFEAFDVDHDTNHVKHRPQNFGTNSQQWHVQYCRGEVPIKTAAEMGYHQGWHSKYWFMSPQNPTWTGGYDTNGIPPSLENHNNQFINFANDHDFRAQSATFPWNRFAAEWTAFVRIETAGQYTFSTFSDDGSRLFVDDALTVDNWNYHGGRNRDGEVTLTKGWHNIRVKFFEYGGRATCQVYYAGPDVNNGTGRTLLSGYH